MVPEPITSDFALAFELTTTTLKEGMIASTVAVGIPQVQLPATSHAVLIAPVQIVAVQIPGVNSSAPKSGVVALRVKPSISVVIPGRGVPRLSSVGLLLVFKCRSVD